MKHQVITILASDLEIKIKSLTNTHADIEFKESGYKTAQLILERMPNHTEWPQRANIFLNKYTQITRLEETAHEQEVRISVAENWFLVELSFLFIHLFNSSLIDILPIDYDRLKTILVTLPRPSIKQEEGKSAMDYLEDSEYILKLVAELQIGYSHDNNIDSSRGYIASQLVVNANWLPYVAKRLEDLIMNKNQAHEDSMKELCEEYECLDTAEYWNKIIESLKDGHTALGITLYYAMPDGYKQEFMCGVHEDSIDDEITKWISK